MTGTGKSYNTTIRASDGVSPLPAETVNDKQFAFREGGYYIGIGFNKPPKPDSSWLNYGKASVISRSTKCLCRVCMPQGGKPV